MRKRAFFPETAPEYAWIREFAQVQLDIWVFMIGDDRAVSFGSDAVTMHTPDIQGAFVWEVLMHTVVNSCYGTGKESPH